MDKDIARTQTLKSTTIQTCSSRSVTGLMTALRRRCVREQRYHSDSGSKAMTPFSEKKHQEEGSHLSRAHGDEQRSLDRQDQAAKINIPWWCRPPVWLTTTPRNSKETAPCGHRFLESRYLGCQYQKTPRAHLPSSTIQNSDTDTALCNN